MLHISVSAYKQAGAERKSDPICRRVGGGGTCMRPGRGSNNGRVYDLHAFWSYCSEVGFIKVPRDNKSCIWVRGFLLTYIPVQFPECLVCVGLGGYINSRDYDGCKFPWQPEWSTQKCMKFQIRGAEGMLVIPLLVIIEMTPHLNKQSGSNQTGSKPS